MNRGGMQVSRRRKSSHPGQILLRHFLKPSGISQEQFARQLGGRWSSDQIDQIINEKESVTVDIAIDFAKVLGTTPDFWLFLQISHDKA
jgi:addiction module HigA family antidote